MDGVFMLAKSSVRVNGRNLEDMLEDEDGEHWTYISTRF
jgi:hypothetical protein